MSTETTTPTEPIASGYLLLTCPDDHTERAYKMSRDAAVTLTIERDERGDPARVWLENPASGRRETVEVEGAAPFVLHLLDMALEVGEDHGRPWRRSQEAD